jgi:hypothetical protein
LVSLITKTKLGLSAICKSTSKKSWIQAPKSFNSGRPLVSHPCPLRRRRKSWHFSCENHVLCGCRDSNPWSPPHTYPHVPLHLTLTCVYIGFWFPTYYPKPSINWLFEALNEFKCKRCQL